MILKCFNKSVKFINEYSKMFVQPGIASLFHLKMEEISLNKISLLF